MQEWSVHEAYSDLLTEVEIKPNQSSGSNQELIKNELIKECIKVLNLYIRTPNTQKKMGVYYTYTHSCMQWMLTNPSAMFV